MKYSVKYGTKNIEFNVEFKDRKTMSISVEPHKKITVVAPLDTSEEEVKVYTEKKAKFEEEKEALKILVNQKSVTVDGHEVELAGNIGSPKAVDGVLTVDVSFLSNILST